MLDEDSSSDRRICFSHSGTSAIYLNVPIERQGRQRSLVVKSEELPVEAKILDEFSTN